MGDRLSSRTVMFLLPKLQTSKMILLNLLITQIFAVISA